MNKSSFVIILMLLGMGAPVWCLAGEGDAMLGMASQGIVRLPHSGMVEEVFGATRRPNVRFSRKPYETSPRIDAKSREALSSGQDVQENEGRFDSKGQENLPDR